MIGENIRFTVFRDTKDFYKTMPAGVVAAPLVRFVRRYAGSSILDLGCATGNYCEHLARLGYHVIGADVNKDYVRIARERGIDAYIIEERVPLSEKMVDTVICFEVLEHLQHPEAVIEEAKRLAQRIVLFTTPNCEGIESLRQEGLLFEHFAELDHRNFFTKDSLDKLLRPYFRDVRIWRGDGVNPFALFGFAPLRFAGKILMKTGVLRAQYYFRLYAVAEV